MIIDANRPSRTKPPYSVMVQSQSTAIRKRVAASGVPDYAGDFASRNSVSRFWRDLSFRMSHSQSFITFHPPRRSFAMFLRSRSTLRTRSPAMSA